MDRCFYCRFGNGAHGADCPQPGTPEMAQWKEGYADGRSGKTDSPTGSQSYRMGYIAGECALEEAENGHDPRFHAAP